MVDRATEIKRLIERRCGAQSHREKALTTKMQKVGRITRVLKFCEPYELDHIMEYLGALIHAIENPEEPS